MAISLFKSKNMEANSLATLFNVPVEDYKRVLEDSKESKVCMSGINIDEQHKKEFKGPKLKIGVPEIDSITGGLTTGMHVIPGFRKCGKSTFALNIIYRALNEGMNVCLLSLEMGKLDVINILLSLHSYELDRKTAVTRDELSILYDCDRPRYEKYFNSFLSLPGNLFIVTEEELLKEDGSRGKTIYNEENLNRVFGMVNKESIKRFNKDIDVLVIDNINCIKSWENASRETAYANASDYFRGLSLNFGQYCDENYETFDGKPIILLLLTQINRSGGSEAKNKGFYSESCIAETVSIERDATTIIPIYMNVELIDGNIAFVKLEASRYSKSMVYPADVPINLMYGKIGIPLDKVNIDEEKIRILNLKNKFELRKVINDEDDVVTIAIPKGSSLPTGYREYYGE